MKKMQINSPEYRGLVSGLLGRDVQFEDVPQIETYKVKYAKIDGSGYDVVDNVDTPEKWYDQQLDLWRAAKDYTAGGGARFKKMLDLQWTFLQDAKAALPK